ncbi:homeobox and C2H2 transcription factor [Apiospora rasikravindrae]|uniref:Homeobox and C2H2 transcription factor n=1 Tax=Apiospora rasikravindrae TaxID=990691 RepID=A0ABR1U1K8_9PEZI
MPTIDELQEMDFINWDAAGAATGLNLEEQSPQGAFDPTQGTNMDLVLGDVDGDDWSFWALEHFDSTHLPQQTTASPPRSLRCSCRNPPRLSLSGIFPNHLVRIVLRCKLIREGLYKGYCTVCVALRCECSFGPVGNHAGSEAGLTFPANPWPTIGDRPGTSILLEDDLVAPLTSVTTMPENDMGVVAKDQQQVAPQPTLPSKPGARFSRESVKILKNWISTHSRHPYPTEEEKETLQRITGLNKTQITNWLANARRRGKIQPTRSTSPHVGRGYATAMDIPRRSGTPGLFENMNPLQRWANSPPENEPASVTDIARAITTSSTDMSSSSSLNSPYVSGYSDDGSSRSIGHHSSASSLSKSQSSGGSFASSFSHHSRGSVGSLPSFARTRGRRRRRRIPQRRSQENLGEKPKTFQCTFCTETFRTKHDWQRHEKSLHLSLERWVCSPEGARAIHSGSGVMSCVFCGEANPTDSHLESHNFSGCMERSLEERTFYRKDHLRQHLKLVHGVSFTSWSMDSWRVTTPEIRSRCGFCSVVMDSWTARTDHLAEHFKTGYTMADWKGDWGFEDPVMNLVENSIPPYMIAHERNSPFPYQASQTPSSTPTNAYDLLKFELKDWIASLPEDQSRELTDEKIQLEACRIVFAGDSLSKSTGPVHSWFRDLIMAKPETSKAAMFRPRGPAEGCLSKVMITGKRDIFENCDLEAELQKFVIARRLLGLTAMDKELQEEACKIIGRMEEKSIDPSEAVANWFIRLIHNDAQWLTDFRRRAHLPRSEDVHDNPQRSHDPKSIDSTIHNYSRLDNELGEFLRSQRSLGLEPSDADLQSKARTIIYEQDDDWNQTAADDSKWLEDFRARHAGGINTGIAMDASIPSSAQLQKPPSPLLGFPTTLTSTPDRQSPRPGNRSRPGIYMYYLNEANCYRRLSKELGRFVASAMSENNPNQHIPTDEELQYQARWIEYDDDDKWNQTPADNPEWLRQFKQNVGILPRDSRQEQLDTTSWTQSLGTTDPSAHRPSIEFDAMLQTPSMNTPYATNDDITAASQAEQLDPMRHETPTRTFGNPQLASGLTAYVCRELQKKSIFPSDADLQARARDIMSMQRTPADDPVLLGKFKASLQGPLSLAAAASAGPALAATQSIRASGLQSGDMPVATESPDDEFQFTMDDMDTSFTDQVFDSIVQDLNASSASSTSPSSITPNTAMQQ